MAHNVRALVRESPTLASLPMIYTRLTEAIDNPRASTMQIADIIASDSALTARLLRLVNSAFYAFSSRIDTVQQAVLLIGTQPIRDLALATSVLSVFPGIPSELVSMQSFWEHSITTGVTAHVSSPRRYRAESDRSWNAEFQQRHVSIGRPEIGGFAPVYFAKTYGMPREVDRRSVTP